jgi:hypothetical protein
MKTADHKCEPEDVCAGLMVTLYLDLIRPLCPQHDDRTLRELMQRHAEAIAAHMVSAGVTAAVQLFNGKGGMS